MIDFSKVRGDLAGTSGVRIFCLGFATAYFITILVTVSLVGGLKDTCVAPDPAHPEKIELEQHGSKHPAFVCAILVWHHWGVVVVPCFILFRMFEKVGVNHGGKLVRIKSHSNGSLKFCVPFTHCTAAGNAGECPVFHNSFIP